MEQTTQAKETTKVKVKKKKKKKASKQLKAIPEADPGEEVGSQDLLSNASPDTSNVKKTS